MIVVGGGVTGLVTAVLLHRAGRRVLVLERHGVGGITTRGSTGKLTALQGRTLLDVAQHRGTERPARGRRCSTLDGWPPASPPT